MTKKLKVLYGIDDSAFSMKTLEATGSLFKDNQRISIQLFHGMPDAMELFKKMGLPDLDHVKDYKTKWLEEKRQFMNRAEKLLSQSGMDPDRISIDLEESCRDPGDAMLKKSEGFGALAAARLGSNTAGRHVIGTVPYRLAELSETVPVWIIDHRNRSRNVLICLVDAPIRRRTTKHAVEFLSHLKDSRFKLFHVIPNFADDMKDYAGNMKRIADEETQILIKAGIPEKNIEIKIQYRKTGIARDILSEVEEGDHGILVIGRKGSKDIKQFGLGSKAYKLLCAARTFMTCLVS